MPRLSDISYPEFLLVLDPDEVKLRRNHERLFPEITRDNSEQQLPPTTEQNTLCDLNDMDKKIRMFFLDLIVPHVRKKA